MAFSSSSSTIKVVLQSIDGKTFEVDKAVTKQSVTIEQLIEDRLIEPVLRSSLMFLRVVTQPPSGENDVEQKAFVSELVNDNEQTLFGLLVAVDYLEIKGLMSLACEDVLDMIKRKAFQHHTRIFLRRRGKDAKR
ncbi:hypothetical protein M9H77_04515 [Catharanthus roseus]|uniref:Uncharacterized protein n=1 Tax=Catharanthus roseus TaxID=4058 RepID=A0ACC0CE94_CATRO|nr:hypothetical protein M9H77_04515 [Catharanthus roseus]